MSSSNNTSLVPILDRTNYRQWAVAMKAFIQSTGMWAYAMGKVDREYFLTRIRSAISSLWLGRLRYSPP
jgi:hypothetical protein